MSRRFQAHPEERLGRITTAGLWDRRYRVPVILPEPDNMNPWVEGLKIIGQAAVLLVCFGAIIFLAAFFSVVQPSVPR